MIASDKFSEANLANGVKYQQNYLKGNNSNEYRAPNQRNSNMSEVNRNERVSRQQSYQ
jgi:hypothetical protein